ncbi:MULTISPECIES: hypothetical protein [unclassified Methylobacterium]|uniref:hypothetical protein n=1 Tax=unclassified Methylobacterium TaxID=2615210 RepID=UPI00226AD731
MTTSVAPLAGELAVAVVSAAGLVNVEGAALVRLAVLVELETGSAEPVDAPVPSAVVGLVEPVVVGLVAPAEAETGLPEFAVEAAVLGEVTASPPESVVLVDPVGMVLVTPFVVAVELSAVVEPAAGLELTALAVSVKLVTAELEEDVAGSFEVAAVTLGVVVLAESVAGVVVETVELDALGSDVPVELVTVEVVALAEPVALVGLTISVPPVEPEATVEFAIVLAAPAVELVVPVASVAAVLLVPVELFTESAALVEPVIELALLVELPSAVLDDPVEFVEPAVELAVLAVPALVVLAVSAEPDAAAVAPYRPGSCPSGAETVPCATATAFGSFEYARM